MTQFCITFGQGHINGDGQRLINRYCIVEAETAAQARAEMFKRRGRKWSNLYYSAREAMVEEYDLKPIALADLTAQPESEAA